MSRWVRLTLLLLTAWCNGLVLANEIVVSATASHAYITTAGQIELTVSATAPIDHAVSLPGSTADFGSFTLVAQSPTIRTIATDQGFQHRATYTLDPFLPGTYTIPPLPIRLSVEKGPTFILKTKPITIAVHSVLGAHPDEAELLDIIEQVPTTSIPWPEWIAAYLLVSAIWLSIALNSRGPNIENQDKPTETSLADKLEQLGHTSSIRVDDLAALLAETRKDTSCEVMWKQLDTYRFSEREPEQAELHELIRAFLGTLKQPGAAA